MKFEIRNSKRARPNAQPQSQCTSSFILHPSSLSSAFSLVEVLAAIAIIGVITFLAIPNIVRVKQDSEDNLARARAESLNLAIASYVQARGTNFAQSNWAGKTDAYRYTNCLVPYIAFAEPSLTAFVPSGYAFTLPSSVVPMTTKTAISNTARSVAITY